MTNHVVSFSGGRTSAYLVWLIIKLIASGWWEKNIGGKVYFIYMDTGAEHPKTYAFIKKCVEYFGIELICLQGDFEQPVGTGHSYKVVDIESLKYDPINGPFGRMMNKYGVPTIASAWCTSRMKEETHDKYCDDRFGVGNYITWLGIRADEPRRLKIGKNPNLRYMAEITDFEKSDVLEFWQKMPFDLEIDEHLGNCVFCFKKSVNKVALAARDEPDLLQQWRSAIESASDRLNKPIEKVTNDIFQETYIQNIPKGVMYRGSNSVDSIIAKFALHSRQEIHDTIRSMKRQESGGCSESCEAFATEQIDMFD